jgi:hypothetical protein
MLCLSLLRKSSKIRNPADMESSKIISRFATSSPKFRGFVVLEDSLGGGGTPTRSAKHDRARDLWRAITEQSPARQGSTSGLPI